MFGFKARYLLLAVLAGVHAPDHRVPDSDCLCAVVPTPRAVELDIRWIFVIHFEFLHELRSTTASAWSKAKAYSNRKRRGVTNKADKVRFSFVTFRNVRTSKDSSFGPMCSKVPHIGPIQVTCRLLRTKMSCRMCEKL